MACMLSSKSSPSSGCGGLRSVSVTGAWSAKTLRNMDAHIRSGLRPSVQVQCSCNARAVDKQAQRNRTHEQMRPRQPMCLRLKSAF
eukprot:13359877-Alexandrium_andersonii.AAC.1